MEEKLYMPTKDFSNLAFYGPTFFSNGSSPQRLNICCSCSKGVLQDPDLLTLLVMMMKEITSILMASVCKAFTSILSLCPYVLRNLRLHFIDEHSEAQRGWYTRPGSHTQ